MIEEKGDLTPYDVGQREGFRRALEGEAPWWQIPGNPDGEYRGNRLASQGRAALAELNLPPVYLVHPATERAVRALCWTLTVILILGLALGIVAVAAAVFVGT